MSLLFSTAEAPVDAHASRVPSTGLMNSEQKVLFLSGEDAEWRRPGGTPAFAL